MSQPLYITLQARAESQIDLGVCNECRECYLRCSAGVPATQAEWDAIQAFVDALESEERAHLNAVLQQSKMVDLGDDVTVELCRFFDMSSLQCAIYAVRPLICRLLGHVEWLPCPIEKVPRLLPTPDALALMQAYSQNKRKTLEEWQREENPEREVD